VACLEVCFILVMCLRVCLILVTCLVIAYWSEPKINFVFVINKDLFVFCICVAHFFHSKINFVGRQKSHSRLKKLTSNT
jgi:hypothetical protein